MREGFEAAPYLLAIMRRCARLSQRLPIVDLAVASDRASKQHKSAEVARSLE